MKQLTRWRAGNKRQPAQILFFRDGVSEGQFEQVKQRELEALQDAAKEVKRWGRTGGVCPHTDRLHRMCMRAHEGVQQGCRNLSERTWLPTKQIDQCTD